MIDILTQGDDVLIVFNHPWVTIVSTIFGGWEGTVLELAQQQDIVKDYIEVYKIQIETFCYSVSLTQYVLLSVYLSVCLSVCLSIYLSVCLTVCLSIYMSVRPSVCLFVCLSVCLSVYPSICLSAFLQSRSCSEF